MIASVESNESISRRLPPAEAWLEPEKWLDMRTGLALPWADKLQLPTDDRGLLVKDDAVRLVLKSLFRQDYQWPYDKNDEQTRPDDHHFYYERRYYRSSHVARRFRELPVNVGLMPRQLHNTMHDFTLRPKKPSFEVMSEYIRNYEIALKLFNAARKALDAQGMFGKRRELLAMGVIQLLKPNGEPREEGDITGEEFMRTFFDKHFQEYSQAVQTINEIIVLDSEIKLSRKPSVAARRLGRIMAQRSLAYYPPDMLYAA